MPDRPKQPQTSHVVSGIAPILGFAFLTAALDVYGGSTVQDVSPQVLAAVSFSMTAAFFLTLQAVRVGLPAALRPLRTHPYDVAAINVTTAVTWLSMLFALKYLEPAVVSVVVVALGPILTILMGPVLRRGSKALRAEVAASLGVCVVLAVLVWESFTGRSAVGSLEPGHAVAGFLLTLACGIGSTANIIYMKRLSEAGQTPQAVLAIRFFLMIAITWVLTALSERPGVGAALWPSLIVAVIGVGLPIYVLQIGIKHTEPITTSLLISVSPLITLLLQLLDGRLTTSAVSWVCTVALIVLMSVGVVKRAQEDRRQEPSAPLPDGASLNPPEDTKTL
ncbi:DMT family transporter [Streptomyces prunicolor]|uniref:DMT family transporter n=1 Tax=Streptomyces prunicolor TaxID=67348 RepID=UPI000371271F|nr:DMT family transporter [Streptomyces prunicolor]